MVILREEALETQLAREYESDLAFLALLRARVTQSGEVELYLTTPRLEGERFPVSLLDLWLPSRAYGRTLPGFLGEGAITYEPGYAASTRHFSDERASYEAALREKLGAQIDWLKNILGHLNAGDGQRAETDYLQHYSAGAIRFVFNEVATHKSAFRDIAALRDAFADFQKGDADAAYRRIRGNDLLRGIVSGAAYEYNLPDSVAPVLTPEKAAAFFGTLQRGEAGKGPYGLEQEGLQIFLLRVRDSYGITLPFLQLEEVVFGRERIAALGLHHSDTLDAPITHVKHGLHALVEDILKPFGLSYDHADRLRTASPGELLSVHLPAIERQIADALARGAAIDRDALEGDIRARLEVLEKGLGALSKPDKPLSGDDLTELFSDQYHDLVFQRIYLDQDSPARALALAFERQGVNIAPFWPHIEAAGLEHADYKQRDHGSKIYTERMKRSPVRDVLQQALGEHAADALWEQIDEPLRQFINLRSQTPQEWFLAEVSQRAAEEGIVIDLSKEGGSIADWEQSLSYKDDKGNVKHPFEGPGDMARVIAIAHEVRSQFRGVTPRFGTVESYPTISEHMTTGLITDLDIPELGSYIRLAQTQYLFDEQGRPRSIFAYANRREDLERYGGPAAPKYPISVFGGDWWDTRFFERTENCYRQRVEKDGLIVSEDRTPGMVNPYLAGAMGLKPIKHAYHTYIADALWDASGRDDARLRQALEKPEAFREAIGGSNNPLLRHLAELENDGLAFVLAPVAQKLEAGYIVPGKYQEILEAWSAQPRLAKGAADGTPIQYAILAYAEPETIRTVIDQANAALPSPGVIEDVSAYVHKINHLRDLICERLPSIRDCTYEEVVERFRTDGLLASDLADPEVFSASVQALRSEPARAL